MGLINSLTTAKKVISSIQEQSKAYFESQLTQMGLGEEQIKQQPLEELQQSLGTMPPKSQIHLGL